VVVMMMVLVMTIVLVDHVSQTFSPNVDIEYPIDPTMHGSHNHILEVVDVTMNASDRRVLNITCNDSLAALGPCPPMIEATERVLVCLVGNGDAPAAPLRAPAVLVS
jgi:hypothetical protein